MALKISEEAKVQMPMKTVASLIAMVAIGTWAYFGLHETLNSHSTKLELIEKDLEQNTEFRIKYPRGQLGKSSGEMATKKSKLSKFEWVKKNIVIVPVVAAILAGTFTSVRYVLSLTDTIEANKQTIVNLSRDLAVAEDKLTEVATRLSAAEATWEMAENLYRQLADQVREHAYDIKDLSR
jgi:hypothetical protein